MIEVSTDQMSLPWKTIAHLQEQQQKLHIPVSYDDAGAYGEDSSNEPQHIYAHAVPDTVSLGTGLGGNQSQGGSVLPREQWTQSTDGDAEADLDYAAVEECASSTCQPVNSDVHHIELGTISIHEPRSFGIVFTNNNPISQRLFLYDSTHPICSCLEKSWEIAAASDEDVASQTLSGARIKTWAMVSQGHPNCFCSHAEETTTSDIFPVHAVLGDGAGAGEQQQQQQQEKAGSPGDSSSSSSAHGLVAAMTGIGPAGTSSNLVPSLQQVLAARGLTLSEAQMSELINTAQEQLANRNYSAYSKFSLNISTSTPIACSVNPSVNAHFAFSMRSLEHCELVPITAGSRTAHFRALNSNALAENFTECYSESAGVGGPTGTRPDPPRRLRDGDRSVIKVELKTDYQDLFLYLHFTATDARLTTSLSPSMDRAEGVQYILGMDRPLTLRTVSGFREPVQDLRVYTLPADYLAYTTPLVRSFADSSSSAYSAYSAQGNESETFGSSESESWDTMVLPRFSCSDGTASFALEPAQMKDILPTRATPYTRYLSLWSCMYNLVVREMHSAEGPDTLPRSVEPAGGPEKP